MFAFFHIQCKKKLFLVLIKKELAKLPRGLIIARRK